MKNKEILKKAIEKAEENGYKFWNVDSKHLRFTDENIWQYKTSPYNYYASVYQVIFSHDFAKAFWGIKKRGYDFVHKREIQEWDHHLKEMVISEDPIKYLEKFLS